MSGYDPVVRVDEVWLPILISVDDNAVHGVQQISHDDLGALEGMCLVVESR